MISCAQGCLTKKLVILAQGLRGQSSSQTRSTTWRMFRLVVLYDATVDLLRLFLSAQLTLEGVKCVPETYFCFSFRLIFGSDSCLNILTGSGGLCMQLVACSFVRQLPCDAPLLRLERCPYCMTSCTFVQLMQKNLKSAFIQLMAMNSKTCDLPDQEIV